MTIYFNTRYEIAEFMYDHRHIQYMVRGKFEAELGIRIVEKYEC